MKNVQLTMKRHPQLGDPPDHWVDLTVTADLLFQDCSHRCAYTVEAEIFSNDAKDIDLGRLVIPAKPILVLPSQVLIPALTPADAAGARTVTFNQVVSRSRLDEDPGSWTEWVSPVPGGPLFKVRVYEDDEVYAVVTVSLPEQVSGRSAEVTVPEQIIDILGPRRFPGPIL